MKESIKMVLKSRFLSDKNIINRGGKSRGFSMIELLVVIGFMAIVSLASAPNVMKTYKRSVYDASVQHFYEVFATARVNALTNKKCNGVAPYSWTINVEHGVSTSKYSLQCNTTTNPTSSPEIIQSVDFITGNRASYAKIEGIGNTTNGANPFIAGSSPASVVFFSGGSQVKINYAGSRQNWLRLVVEHAGTSLKKTICINNIQAFSTLNPKGVNCAE